MLEYVLYIYIAKYENTNEALEQFTPVMATTQLQFVSPHAKSLVEHHMITIFQHFYLYHHVLTEVQQVDVSNTLVTCHTPTHHPILKGAMQEDEWHKAMQLSSLEKVYAEKRSELTTADVSDEQQPVEGSHDQLLTREEVGQVTRQLLGNIIERTKRKIEQNIKGQELTVNFASEKIKILTNKQPDDSLPPSQKSINTPSRKSANSQKSANNSRKSANTPQKSVNT